MCVVSVCVVLCNFFKKIFPRHCVFHIEIHIDFLYYKNVYGVCGRLVATYV
jgi:hypothetical protein